MNPPHNSSKNSTTETKNRKLANYILITRELIHRYMTIDNSTNPFGAAKPRETVLASKGVDYREFDRKLDEKASAGHQCDNLDEENGRLRHHSRRDSHRGEHMHHQPRCVHSFRERIRPNHQHPYICHESTNKRSNCGDDSGNCGGGGRLTPSQAIHPPPSHSQHSPRQHHRQFFDKEDDEWTHDTASVTTIHSHHTTLSGVAGVGGGSTHKGHHHSPGTNPFGAARPREEVLSDKGIDARVIDAEIDKVVQTQNLVALNHPGESAENTNTVPSDKHTTISTVSTRIQQKKKIDPFGEAKPREVVLASKGVDYRTVDKLVDRKMAAEHLTPEQEAEAEIIRLKLTQAENAYWGANENELPEEELRLDMETKRKELHDLLFKFQEMNLSCQGVDGGFSAKAELSRKEQGSVKAKAVKDEANDQKVEYHFQGRDRENDQREDRSSSYRQRSPPRNQRREEYHGGDARRYNYVERPWYASQKRYGDGENDYSQPKHGHGRIRSGYDGRGRGNGGGGGGGGYYRGGRGRRYGRGGGPTCDRYSRGSGLGGDAGYGDHSRSYGRRFDDNDDDGRGDGRCSEGREHWALVD